MTDVSTRRGPTDIVVTVRNADLFDRGDDGGAWAHLYTVPQGALVQMLGAVVTEAFDASGQDTPQLVDDDNQVPIGLFFQTLDTETEVEAGACADGFDDQNWPVLAATQKLEVWLMVGTWGYDGTQGSVDIYLRILARGS